MRISHQRELERLRPKSWRIIITHLAPFEEKDHAVLIEVLSIYEECPWVDAARHETEGSVEVSGLLISSDNGKLDLFKSVNRLGKFNGFGHKGLSDALSLLFGSDVHAPDVAPVLLFFPIILRNPTTPINASWRWAPSVKLFGDSAVRRRPSATNSKEYSLSRS